MDGRRHPSQTQISASDIVANTTAIIDLLPGVVASNSCANPPLLASLIHSVGLSRRRRRQSAGGRPRGMKVGDGRGFQDEALTFQIGERYFGNTFKRVARGER